MLNRLALLAAAAVGARAGLLYGIVTTDSDSVLTTGLISPPNATLRPLGTAAAPLIAVSQLAAPNGDVVYLLVANLSSSFMDLVGLVVATAAEVSHVPTSLPVQQGILGTGQAMAYDAQTGEVAVFGQTSDAGAPWVVQAIEPTTGASRVVRSWPANAFIGFLGNGLAAYDVTSDAFYFGMRNGTSADRAVDGFFVDMTSGATRVVANDCTFDAAAYDPEGRMLYGVATWRNGSTLQDVYHVVASVAANGTEPCRPGPIIFDENSFLPYIFDSSIVAYDAESRTMFAYAIAGDEATSPAALLAGAFVMYNTTADQTADTLFVSAMCQPGAEHAACVAAQRRS